MTTSSRMSKRSGDRTSQRLIGGDKAIITSATFTALLLMAIASTMLTVPVVTPKLQRMKQLILRSR